MYLSGDWMKLEFVLYIFGATENYVQWNLDLTNLDITMSSVYRTIFLASAVIEKICG